MMTRNLLALFGVKWNPFSPDIPIEALWRTPKIEHFCWRLENLAREGGFALITGDPGTGKSVALRTLAHHLALMLTLRDVARRWQLPGCTGEERSIDAALEDWSGSHMGSGWQGRLGATLRTGTGPRPILLVDGWDEVGPLGGELRGKLLGFLHEHPRVLAVVTSRPYGEDPPSHGDRFEILDLLPLSDGDIEALTRGFFRRFATGGDGGGQDAGDFLAALEQSPEARDLARTPLLLTMMLLVGHSQPLPEKRHLLYDKCVDALINARPEDKAARGALAGRHVWCPPGIDERRRWVAALAFRVQTEGYKSGSRAPITRARDEMKSFLEECPPDNREGFLSWLVETAGLLADRADGTLAFSHLSFQEYLTAHHLETTAEDAGGRAAAFEARLGDVDWWETLRLLAALIEGRNPDFLASVLEGLVRTADADGPVLAFAGTILADGLGPPALFEHWQSRWLDGLSRRWPWGADLCSIAWLAARQRDRKALLSQAVAARAADQTWLGWLRLGEFSKGWALLPTEPAKPVASAVIGQLRGREVSAEGIAAGRLLCGGFPFWPTIEDHVGLLQIWPSRRRLAGLRLQSAIAAAAPREALKTLAGEVLAHPVETDETRHLEREWARQLERDLEREWAHHGELDLERDWVHDWELDLDHDWVHDWVRDWVLHWVRDWVHDCVRYGVRYWARDWVSFGVRYWARYGARNWARDLTHLARLLDRDRARDLEREWAREWARNLARYRARDLGIAWSEEWLEDFAMVETVFLGRVAGRALLASLELQDRPFAPPLHLLVEANRRSPRPQEGARLLLPLTGENIDPLWPALARHLARQSTAADRRAPRRSRPPPREARAPSPMGPPLHRPRRPDARRRILPDPRRARRRSRPRTPPLSRRDGARARAVARLGAVGSNGWLQTTPRVPWQ